MPSLSSLLLTMVASASLVFAIPSASPPYGATVADTNAARRQSCLTSADSPALAAQFADLVGNYTAAKADAFLLEDYQDYSDGINSLQGKPLGSVTFDGREAFKAAQAGHGGTPMVVDTVVATTCDTVVWTWTATFGVADETVRGINIVKFAPGGGEDGAASWWVERVDMEMNSLAYLDDLGGSWSLPAQ